MHAQDLYSIIAQTVIWNFLFCNGVDTRINVGVKLIGRREIEDQVEDTSLVCLWVGGANVSFLFKSARLAQLSHAHVLRVLAYKQEVRWDPIIASAENV